MSNSLKHCPFCGAAAAMEYRSMAVVYCTACPANVTIDIHPGPFKSKPKEHQRREKNMAVEAWNRRITDAGRNAMKEGR